MGLFDKHLNEDFSPFFAERALALYEAGIRNPEWQCLFDTLAKLCHTLALKSDVGIQILTAYVVDGREKL